MVTSSSPSTSLSEVEVSHPWSEEETYLPRMLPFLVSELLRDFFFTMGLVRTEGADLYLFLMFFTSNLGLYCSLVSLCVFSALLRLTSRYYRLVDLAGGKAALEMKWLGISLMSSISVSTSGHTVNLLLSAALFFVLGGFLGLAVFSKGLACATYFCFGGFIGT
jgi:hypothetical protein